MRRHWQEGTDPQKLQGVISQCPACGVESAPFEVGRPTSTSRAWGRTVLVPWVCRNCRTRALAIVFAQGEDLVGIGVVTHLARRGRHRAPLAPVQEEDKKQQSPLIRANEPVGNA